MDPLIVSDAEKEEYWEETVLYLSDPTLPAGYCASFASAVEVHCVICVYRHCNNKSSLLGERNDVYERSRWFECFI